MLKFRKAKEEDVDLIFNWSNDPLVRQFSYNQEQIVYKDHMKWFNSKIKDNNASFYIFINELDEEIGLVRIEINNNEVIIGILIDKKQRGKSYATKMLTMASDHFYCHNPLKSITAYIKKDNIASIKSFTKAGFVYSEELKVNNIPSVKLIKVNSL